MITPDPSNGGSFVEGNTFHYRDCIRMMEGATWQPEHRRWAVQTAPGEAERRLRGTGAVVENRDLPQSPDEEGGNGVQRRSSSNQVEDNISEDEFDECEGSQAANSNISASPNDNINLASDD